MSTKHRRTAFSLVLFVLLIGGLAACESGPDRILDSDSSLLVTGKVTDDAGFPKTMAEVDDAEVTASEVDSEGRRQPREEKTMTDATGAYTLDLNTTASTLILYAAKTGFNSGVIVEIDQSGSASTGAMPMNSETYAEASVFAEGQSGAGERLTASDVTFFVDAEVAADIQDGTTTAAEVAAALAEGKSAERSHAEQDPEGFSDDEPRRRIKEDRRESFLALQTQLNSSTSAAAQTAAREQFERSYIEAFADQGVNAEVEARAAYSRRSAMLEAAAKASFSVEAEFALMKRAELAVALASSAAIESLFRANAVAQAQIDAVVAAGEVLHDAVVGASTEAEISAAFAGFSASVQGELSTAIGVSTGAIATARTATEAAKVTLQTAVETAANASEIANAYVTFFTSAQASATASLSGSTNASLGGEVLSLIAVR